MQLNQQLVCTLYRQRYPRNKVDLGLVNCFLSSVFTLKGPVAFHYQIHKVKKNIALGLKNLKVMCEERMHF